MQDKSHKWLLAAQAQMKTCQVNHLQKVFFYYPDRKLLGAKYIDFKAARYVCSYFYPTVDMWVCGHGEHKNWFTEVRVLMNWYLRRK